jgi:predicted transglutaminase-like cysteine proteinase
MKHVREIAVAALAVVGAIQVANAGLIGMPRQLQTAVERIRFGTLTLAPFAYTEFCIRHASECPTPPGMTFRGGSARLSQQRWDELVAINGEVNRAIRPQRNTRGLSAEKWLIGPSSGDCNDYAVTKRHELIKRGWPPRNLLLSEVVTRWGEHHLVLVVRTTRGDLVLDNLSANIRAWKSAPYRWVRMQLPTNSKLWTTLSERSA